MLDPRIVDLALEGEKGGEDRFLGSAPDLLLVGDPSLLLSSGDLLPSLLPLVKHSVTRSPQISDVSASPSRLLHRIVNGSLRRKEWKLLASGEMDGSSVASGVCS